MIIEKLEKRLGQVLDTAKQLQQQAESLQKQGKVITQQGEVKAREFLHQIFDSGLTLLGQSIVSGRRATESFVAETHRKASRLKHLTDELGSEGKSSLKEEVFESQNENSNAKQKVTKNPKFKMAKNKKNRAHLNNTSRSH